MTIERAAIERRVAASIDAGRIPVLLGGCGSGRTTVMRRLAEASAKTDRHAHSLYIDLAAVATTPERCLTAITGNAVPAGTTARAAFDLLMDRFDLSAGAAAQPDRATATDGAQPLFLLDEFQELRTFENFPGLRDVQQAFITRLAASPNQFVLSSRFTARAHRLLRDAPARFEVIHMPALELADVEAMARARDGRADWARHAAPAVHAISAGRSGYATALIDAMAGSALSEAETALAELFAPAGRLTALCRFSYEFRLHRARGYGALKAILGILSEEEPLTLTDIANRLHRTPGSTKDYLSWLEDVDVVNVERKRYTFDDPLVRLYVRLYTGAEPPSADRILAQTRQFAAARLAAPGSRRPPRPPRQPRRQHRRPRPQPKHVIRALLKLISRVYEWRYDLAPEDSVVIRRIGISVCSVVLSAFVFSSAVTVRAYQAAGVAGTWKLNEAQSNNPNGLPPGQPAPARPKGMGTEKDMTGGAARPGAGAQAASELSPEEKTRINRMLGLMNKAAQTLEIVVEGNDMTIKQDGSGFPKQNADGKKFPLKNPQIGEVDIKIKTDAKGMTREISTQDDLKVVETYTLSADGKQLTVTMKPSQPVMKIEDAKIKRVYDRQ